MNLKIVSAVVLLACMCYACEGKATMYSQGQAPINDAWLKKTQKLTKGNFDEMKDDGENYFTSGRQSLKSSQSRRRLFSDDSSELHDLPRPRDYHNGYNGQSRTTPQPMVILLNDGSLKQNSGSHESSIDADYAANKISKDY